MTLICVSDWDKVKHTLVTKATPEPTAESAKVNAPAALTRHGPNRGCWFIASPLKIKIDQKNEDRKTTKCKLSRSILLRILGMQSPMTKSRRFPKQPERLKVANTISWPRCLLGSTSAVLDDMIEEKRRRCSNRGEGAERGKRGVSEVPQSEKGIIRRVGVVADGVHE